VASAYGDAGLNYLKDITFEKEKGGLFPTELPGVEIDPKADPKADPKVDPATGKTVKLPGDNSDGFSFSGMFDVGYDVATGKTDLATADAAAAARWAQPKSPAQYVLGPAGALTGAAAGLAKESTVGLWDWATTRR
jgi:hypothetical protein